MLKLRRWQVIFAALLAVYVIWFWWWASSGYILEGQICEIPEPPKNCGNHNVFFYFAYRLATIANEWGVLITAIATIVIALFTATLWYVSRDTLWTAIKSVELVRDEFLSTHRPKIRIKHVCC